MQRATYPPSKIFGVCIATSEGLRSVAPMAANGSGLQWSTIRNIAMAWVLTLPIAMMLSGTLYYCFAQIF